ncbi:MAG: VanZ family protein [SAR324 cluster bacterium]|nr:VanZ family protein [SAR324 cluster bacterium]MCZ6843223.1 VanZ family protein [SAR324 cluster bacterium]
MSNSFPNRRNRIFALAAVLYLAFLFSTLSVMPLFLRWVFTLTGRTGYSLTISLFMIAVATLVLFIVRRALFPLGLVRALGLLGIGVGYGLLIHWADSPSSRLHALQYGILALLVTESLRGAMSLPKMHLCALLLVMGASLLDEGIQWLLPNRAGLLLEVLLNWGSAALAQGAIILLKDSRGEAPPLALGRG